MNTLAARLLLAFALVIVVGGAVTVLIAGRTTSSEIRHLMMMEQLGQIDTMHQMMHPEVEQAVTRVNHAVWLAAGVAGLLAFGLAFLIVRTVSAPLARMAVAAQAVAGGDLAVQVPVAGPAEVQRVAGAFNQMTETLKQQEGLRRAMLADVAHELRTPLTVMQGQIEALTDGIFPATPEHLMPLHAQVLHLTHLVEELRTLAHADAGELRLNRVAVALPALLDELLAEFRAEATRREVVLSSTLPDELPPLDADPVRLRQVLDNLLSNALRHTPAGGSVTLAAALAGDEVRVSVSDTGEGIAPEALPHVFERFYRVDRSRSRATGGSGLGLAIARRLTEGHGGRIAISSELGQGTTVTLHWPAWQGR